MNDWKIKSLFALLPVALAQDEVLQTLRLPPA
jgi:hypothetical protein